MLEFFLSSAELNWGVKKSQEQINSKKRIDSKKAFLRKFKMLN